MGQSCRGGGATGLRGGAAAGEARSSLCKQARLRLHSLLDSDAWRALKGSWEQLVRIGGLDASYLTDGELQLRRDCDARRAATEAAARRTAVLRRAERQAARAERRREARRRRNRTPAQVKAEIPFVLLLLRGLDPMTYEDAMMRSMMTA